MAPKKRKIAFYYLTVNENLNLLDTFNQVLNHINSLEKTEKKISLGNNKFCLLDTLQFLNNNVKSKIIFKSATHNYRPNLIHKETVDERESPKQLQEGEIEKTHIVTKFENDTISLIVEKHMQGITIGQFVKYLNNFAHQIESEERINFGFEIVVKDNFLQEINSLSRITAADIVVDKQLLGSEALNYSNRIDHVKHEVTVSVKAKNNDNIEDFVRDTFAKMNGGQRDITKIRIVGRNEDNNEVILNTDFIERQEFINPEINDVTGELLTNEVFIEMLASLENF